MRDRKSDTTHRRVAEAKLGRKLHANEIVHHADEDKENNAPANLAVDRRGPHTAQHNKGRHVSQLRAALRSTLGRGPKLYSVALLFSLSGAADPRVAAAYDANTALITCTVAPHPRNRHLNLAVHGYDIRRPDRPDQAVGHVLTGQSDPTTFTYRIPPLQCESAPTLDAWCELFSVEGQPPRPVYRRATAPIPCTDIASPDDRQPQ